MNVKRFATICMLAIMVALLGSAAVALGAEEIIEGTVTNVVTAPDSNGNPYTRLIVTFQRSLEGNDYEVGLPVLGFGELAAPAAEKQPGDPLKAIVQNRVYQGRESYTIIRMLE